MEQNDIEEHPWDAFVPDGAWLLIAGTFPPARKRWSMDFFYPNPTNDFWRIMGLIYYGDKDALWLPQERRFDLPRIKQLLTDKGIAMSDTARQARRLMGNASDKFLEIVEPIDLDGLRKRVPTLRAIATTGEKAALVVASLTGTEAPKMGEYVDHDGLRIWRMPSTSRAYPLALDKKADYYRRLLGDNDKPSAL